jgi:WD40 repeat protein
VVDERFGLEATQEGADVIEVRSEDWSLRFHGTAPAFRPEGRLTFIRDGRLLEWTVRCPPSAERVVFRGLRALVRCPNPVENAPDRLREVIWLDSREFVGIAGQDLYSTLAVVRPEGSETIFRAIGARMGSLSASPDGRYVSVRIDGQLAVFDVERTRPMPLPGGADQATAIDWSPDGAYTVIASLRSLHVYPASRPNEAVTLPLSAIDADWR